jgi:ubiquinone/menaquinone biosynthesis C-methylase UbiE
MMAFYREHVLPRIQNKVMDNEKMHETRERVCHGLHGEIVEIGFGTGLNASHYPDAVTTILAIEPSDRCMHLAEPRLVGLSATVERAGLDGERLDLPSAQYDAVLSTWTLCTIPDLDAALAEIRRVLKPGGSLHFVEHGHSPDDKVARWQARLEPLNKRLLGGCHLTRRISDSIQQAGFTVEQLDTYYAKGDPKPFGYTYEGRALKA